jgi:hypothetical protein
MPSGTTPAESECGGDDGRTDYFDVAAPVIAGNYVNRSLDGDLGATGL